jgi:hypothetical protein
MANGRICFSADFLRIIPFFPNEVIHSPYVILNASDKRFHHKGGPIAGSFEEEHPGVGKIFWKNRQNLQTDHLIRCRRSRCPLQRSWSCNRPIGYDKACLLVVVSDQDRRNSPLNFACVNWLDEISRRHRRALKRQRRPLTMDGADVDEGDENGTALEIQNTNGFPARWWPSPSSAALV